MKCNVCGHEFTPKKEDRYIAAKNNGLFQSNTYYDCFDCSECGCQIVAQERYENAGQLCEYKPVTEAEE